MAIQQKEEVRAFGGRSKERREAEIRAVQSMEYTDMMKIPESIIPRGMVYGWAAYSVLGQPRPERIWQARIKGWDFVPVDRHPEMTFQGIGEVDPRASGYIWRGGNVLMERPIELQQIADRRMDEVNFQTLLTTPGLEGSAYPTQIGTQYYEGSLADGHKNASFGS
jgi:hypothetical protein